MYSPNLGFEPRTRLEMIKEAYKKWVDLTGTTDTFADFQGTNMHLVLNVFFEQIEKLEAKIVELQSAQFDYWQTNNMAVLSSYGSAYEGWQKLFEPLCTGLDIQGNMENTKLRPGEITIYFDNLVASEQELKDALLRCKNIAEPTVGGDHKIQITYSNGQTRDYTYFNLKPEDYTDLHIQIKVTYEKRGLTYKDTDFTNHFYDRFNKVNHINKSFYPESYMDISPFPGVADFEITSKIDGDLDWVAGPREIQAGNKFTIKSVIIA